MFFKLDWLFFLGIALILFFISSIFEILSEDKKADYIENLKILDIESFGNSLRFKFEYLKGKICTSIAYEGKNSKLKVGDNVKVSIFYKKGIPFAVIHDENTIYPKYKDNIYISYFLKIFAYFFILISFVIIIQLFL